MTDQACYAEKRVILADALEVSANAPLVCPEALWQENSNGPVSLAWIMDRFDLLGFASAVSRINDAKSLCGVLSQSPERDRYPADLAMFEDIANHVAQYSGKVGFHDSAMVALDLSARLKFVAPRFDYSSLSSEMHHLQMSLLLELRKYQFVQINTALVQYFNQDEVLGTEVARKFPDTGVDAKSAGNCISVGLGTAAVFHLMRVAEHGLRYLAKRLKVKLLHSGRNQPIEFAEWNKVITAIKNKITSARALAPGPKKQDQLEKWSEAADHCEYMKDIFRNNISHTRNAYLPSEAIAAFERVRSFMGFLADGL